MKNYCKNLWWGALKYPSRWVYAQYNPVVFVGIVVSFFTVGLFWKVGVIIALITLILWARYIITADRVYMLPDNNNGKTVYITIFRSGYRPVTNTYDKRLQKALLRTYVVRDDDETQRILINGVQIRGYDERYKNLGMFLYRTTLCDWRLISAKYYNSLYLGRNVQENLYVEDGKTPMVATFLHGEMVARFEATYLKINPHYIWDGSKASFKPVAESEMVEPTKSTQEYTLVGLQNKNKKKLYCFGIKKGIPTAFQVMVPFVYQYDSRFNKAIPTDREDGSFS